MARPRIPAGASARVSRPHTFRCGKAPSTAAGSLLSSRTLVCCPRASKSSTGSGRAHRHPPRGASRSASRSAAVRAKLRPSLPTSSRGRPGPTSGATGSVGSGPSDPGAPGQRPAVASDAGVARRPGRVSPSARGGRFILAVPRGVHQVLLEGRIAERKAVQLALGVVPGYAQARAMGWKVDGIHAGRPRG